jgi:hypothetical protein
MTLSEGHSQGAASKPGKRRFESWWASVPEDLKQKARKGQKGKNNKPLLSHVNYVLLHLHLAGKHDAKPTSEELNYWLHSGQVNDKI